MNTTTSHAKEETQALGPQMAAFEAMEKATNGAAPSWLRCLRTSGIAYFADLGLPTATMEDWRQTNPEPLASFGFSSPSRPSNWSHGMIDGWTLPGMDASRLVLVDGWFMPELGRWPRHAGGVQIGSLEETIRSRPQWIERFLGRAARYETNALAAMNTAFLRDGVVVHVPAGVRLSAPVYILHLATTKGAVIQPRVLVVADANAQVEVVEDFVSLGSQPSWTNSVTEIFAAEGATVEHVKIQRENRHSLHTALVEARQRAQSRIVSHSISLGARLARNDINLRLEAPGCDSVLNGLYVAEGDQLVDHHTIADHASPHCASHEFYHGILTGRAKGVFNGRIYVRQGAQKTDAKQTNRNLLLSTEATVHTKPQLEIFADDVKCTHGATVGQLDDQALFYLRARGIGETAARRMLIQAFAADVLNRISREPLRNGLESLLNTFLENHPVVT